VNKSVFFFNLLRARVPKRILMKNIHIGVLTMFTNLGSRRVFSQFVYCDEKYFQLKLVNI
jgi:hypothetical protein